MGPNEPKRAQEILDILKTMVYELKMVLNEVKWVSLNEQKKCLNGL